MAGRRTSNRLQIANQRLLQRDRTMISDKTINELYIFIQHRLSAEEYKAATSPMLQRYLPYYPKSVAVLKCVDL